VAPGSIRTHFSARRESHHEDRGQTRPTALGRLNPSGRLVSLERARRGPAAENRHLSQSGGIDFRSLSRILGTHQLLRRRDPFGGWILPSALAMEPCVLIQAQMEDKGVGLIDQAAQTPV
jgi:hypothetical protein